MFLEITFTTDGEISPSFKLVFDFAEYLRILLEYEQLNLLKYLEIKMSVLDKFLEKRI